MQNNLNTLMTYNNRYYTSSTGSQASTWILNTVSSVRKNWAQYLANRALDVDRQLREHVRRDGVGVQALLGTEQRYS